MEFLFELMTEEMPPSHVRSALEQIGRSLPAELAAADLWLREAKDPAQVFRTYGTCRRVIVLAEIEARQKDRQVKVVGPSKSAAFAPDGSPTQATLGFARSRGIDPAGLEVITTEKGEYVGFSKIEPGKPAADLLPEVLVRVLSGLTFPKMMRWGENPIRFSRPVKNILCLLDGRPLAFSFAGVAAGDTTFGHKLLAPEAVRPGSFAEYRDLLGQAKVVVDEAERRIMIQSQAETLLSPLKAQMLADPELLERLTFDVEQPFVFLGSFPEEYLALPLEILSTAMREGQRLFSVVQGKEQLAYFLGVADVSADPKSLIRSGNERVLRARLEDARFFWAQDIKMSLERRAAGLKRVVFQEKLGSYEDKSQRLKKLVGYLCDKLDSSEIKKDVVLAAGLCKADLLTEMVGEFSALQGKMGGLLAAAEELGETTSRAIYEHYLPVGLEDESPASTGGSILSMADKLDSLVGVIGLGVQTSGSSDPFGLRRNAHGVCKIILDKKLVFSFHRLLEKAAEVYGTKLDKGTAQIKASCLDFFINRLRYVFEKQGFRYDLINAAFGAGLDNIYYCSLRLQALHALRSSPQFEPFILMAKRVNNIIRDQQVFKFNPPLFQEKEEKELHALFVLIKENIGPMVAQGDFNQAQRMIFRIQPALNAFFDKVLVMDPDSRLRKNRLGLLQAISKLLLSLADYSQVVVEGEKA